VAAQRKTLQGQQKGPNKPIFSSLQLHNETSITSLSIKRRREKQEQYLGGNTRITKTVDVESQIERKS